MVFIRNILNILNRFVLSFKPLFHNRLFITVILTALLLSIIRVFHIANTGFILADESRYILDAISGQIYDNVNRPIPGFLNVLLFKLFRIDNIGDFLIFFSIYQMCLSLVVIISAYKITELLGIKERAKNMTVISLLFMPTYALMSMTFLTEQLSLVFSITGIYFAFKYVKEQNIKSAISLAILFVCASLVREPYVIFPLFALVIILIMFKPKKSHFINFLIVSAITIPFIDLPFIALSQIMTILPLEIFEANLLSNQITPSLTSIAKISNTVQIFITVLVIGWNPIIFLLVIFAFFKTASDTVKNITRENIALIYIISLPLLSTLGVAFFASQVPEFYLSTQGYSTLIRYSHVSIPSAIILLGLSYDKLSDRIPNKISRRTLTISALIILIIFGLMTPFYMKASQSNLIGENRTGITEHFSFEYKMPWLTTRNFLKELPENEEIHVADYIGRPMWLYLYDLENVTIYWPRCRPQWEPQPTVYNYLVFENYLSENDERVDFKQIIVDYAVFSDDPKVLGTSRRIHHPYERHPENIIGCHADLPKKLMENRKIMSLHDNLFLEIKPKRMYVVNSIIDNDEFNRRIENHEKEINFMPYYEQDIYRAHLEKIETSREHYTITKEKEIVFYTIKDTQKITLGGEYEIIKTDIEWS